MSDSKPKNKINEHLSVDTRLAAKAILDDESIGRVSSAPIIKEAPAFVDWLLNVRIRLTVAICAVMALVTLLPIWFEVSHRDRTQSLQVVLTTQVKQLVKSAGKKNLARWFRTKDIDALRKHYVKFRPQVVQGLKDAGFKIGIDKLSVRVDYDHQTLLLGARLDHGEHGVFMTWASPTTATALRPLPQASVGAVLGENRDLLTIMGLIVILCLVFVWLAPAIYRRQNN